MKSALKIINVNKPNDMVCIKQSSIKDKLNMGMFATRDIKKGTPITIYFGDVLDEEELLEKYNNDKDIMKYIRKGHDFIVDGSMGYQTDNLNLNGIYVNDIFKLKSKSKKDIKHYHKSRNICNVEVMETGDFPVYVARRNIKKGQELFVHYGVGFWLCELGVSPQDLKTKYGKIISQLK